MDGWMDRRGGRRGRGVEWEWAMGIGEGESDLPACLLARGPGQMMNGMERTPPRWARFK